MKRNAVFLMTTLLVALMVSFTSCLSSGSSGAGWDYSGYFTKSSGYSGGVAYNYIADNGYLFYFTGLSEMPERGLFYIKLGEGEELTSAKVINASVYAGYSVIINEFTNQKDTIEADVNDFAIAELPSNTSSSAPNTWVANGFLNIGFKYYFDSYATYYSGDVAFELLAESVEDGVLNARLVQTRGGVLPGKTPYGTSNTVLICYRLPTIDDLNDILGDNGSVSITNMKIRIIANSLTPNIQYDLDPIDVTFNY